MLWKIFFCLLGLTLSCHGAPTEKAQENILSFSRVDLKGWITVKQAGSYFSEEEKGEFVKSTVAAAAK